ncbi:hypothetical protein PIB30_052571 [Stylosanthes scabra]|uniref:Uncharacterized protein n=1 Tax=Stylosanthes scabra TaxID=79078 RepID=A0ABU6YIE7_9FABA|nr:hypothetical protein [Stylosanthes scabra]
MKEVLSCVELIKWEEDSQSVREYLGEKSLGLKSTSMKAFLRQRASWKEVSVSKACKDVGGEGGYTSSRVRHVGEGYEKGKEKKMAMDEVEKAFKSQLSLHGYKGSEDLSSLWSENYPFTALAEDYGQSLADVKFVTEAGALAVMGPRMMSIGRTKEKMLLKMFEEKAVVSKMESLLKVKEDVVSSLTATIETKEYEMAKLEVDLKEKTDQGYEMYVQGFERAVSQVRVIAPNVDVNKMDVTKVVVNGVMVDYDIVGQDDKSVGKEDHQGEKFSLAKCGSLLTRFRASILGKRRKCKRENGVVKVQPHGGRQCSAPVTEGDDEVIMERREESTILETTKSSSQPRTREISFHGGGLLFGQQGGTVRAGLQNS